MESESKTTQIELNGKSDLSNVRRKQLSLALCLEPDGQVFRPSGSSWIKTQAERITVNEYNRSAFCNDVYKELKQKNDIFDLKSSIIRYQNKAKLLLQVPKFTAQDYAKVDSSPHITLHEHGTVVLGPEKITYKPYSLTQVKDVRAIVLEGTAPDTYLWKDFKTFDKDQSYLGAPMTGYSYYAESVQRVLAHFLEYDETDPVSKLQMYWIEDLINTHMYLECMKIDLETSTTGKPRRQWWDFPPESNIQKQMVEKCQTVFDELMTWATKNVPAFKFSWKRTNQWFVK